MSIKERLANKSGNIKDAIDSMDRKISNTPSAPRTGPGQMAVFSKEMKHSQEKIADLEQQLKEFKETDLAKLLDPTKIKHSKWANRIEQSFTDEEYIALKEAIQTAGKNVQPIKVRRISKKKEEQKEEFELVFGHRRHQACFELGIPVLAIVADDMSDQQLFLEMDQENRARKDLSAWEQAQSYQRAIAEGLYSSQNALAKDLGLSQGNISILFKISELPIEIIEAFNNPNDIKFRWVREILAVIKKDQAGVLERARAIKKQGDVTPLQVFKMLIKKSTLTVKWDKKINEVTFTRRKGNISIACGKIELDSEQQEKLKKAIENCLHEMFN